MADAQRPRCFGAAARDPERPCENKRLRSRVTPTPAQALLDPGEGCTVIKRPNKPDACAFGVPATKAKRKFALIGDSHAEHWRAALAVIARRKNWRGLSLYHTRCGLNLAPKPKDDRIYTSCNRWRDGVFRWLRANPSVRTMFVSSDARTNVSYPPGESMFETKVRGYIAAWNAVPESIERIYVLRDVPINPSNGNACVQRAMRRGVRRMDLACARSREVALPPHAAEVAALRLDSPRVQLIDLTDHMCDAERCYPVVGGVLVRKDIGHLTRVFARTLAPYIERELD